VNVATLETKCSEKIINETSDGVAPVAPIAADEGIAPGGLFGRDEGRPVGILTMGNYCYTTNIFRVEDQGRSEQCH
jgi:hypothetical protein